MNSNINNNLETEYSPAITLVFSVTWSLRNHVNILFGIPKKMVVNFENNYDA